MKKRIVLPLAALLCTLGLNSCIHQAVMAFVRDEYPGQRPPMVIADTNGQPASNDKWIAADPNALPPSSLLDSELSYGPDNIPYGITSEFSNIVTSPYAPNYQLDYTGISVGAKVWDPYTRKPFYIPRAYSFN